MGDEETDRVDLHRASDHNDQAALLAELEHAGVEAWAGPELTVRVARPDEARAKAILARWLGASESQDRAHITPRTGLLKLPSPWTVALLVAFTLSLGLNAYFFRELVSQRETSGTVTDYWPSGEVRAVFEYREGGAYPHLIRHVTREGRPIYTFYDAHADGNAERSVQHGPVSTTYTDRDEDGLYERGHTPLSDGRELTEDDLDGDGAFEQAQLRAGGEILVRWSDHDRDTIFEVAELLRPSEAQALDHDGDGFYEEIRCGEERRFDAVRCEWLGEP